MLRSGVRTFDFLISISKGRTPMLSQLQLNVLRTSRSMTSCPSRFWSVISGKKRARSARAACMSLPLRAAHLRLHDLIFSDQQPEFSPHPN